jgi:hypothetical protein
MNALPFCGISQFLEIPGEFTQTQKVGGRMKNYPVAPVLTLGEENANPGNRDAIVAFEEEIDKGSISLSAVNAAEKLAARAETTALAVMAAEAIVAMALSAATAVAGRLDKTAQETLLVAQKAAAKTLQVAKEDAEETLALAKVVAKELLEEASRKNVGSASTSSIQGHLEDC